MEKQRSPPGGSRRSFLHAAGTAGVGLLAGAAGCVSGGDGPEEVAVFHAGSLAPPFSATADRFEADGELSVRREAWGSVEATRRVTAQGLRPDVLAVAYFRLLRDRLLPEYGDWYAVFAANAMVVQYRPGAPGADRISTDDWWAVLARDDVALGIADPALDPGGYRALMTLELGAVPFEGSALYGEATRRRLRANAAVTTGNERVLTTQVRSGELDYAITYRSLGETADLPYLDLQPEVDLSRATPAYARHYAAVAVETDTGTYAGSPIAYGIAVPSVARRPGSGARWVESVVAGGGRSDLEAAGLVATDPPVVPAGVEGTVPRRVLDHAEPRARLGPLPLLPE
jgi:molybdate/tungstate transport system substrate-binding protein